MTPLRWYLAEEVAIDHADGIISRREAVRRLSLLGLTTVGAAALLAACGGSDDETAAGPSPTGPEATASPTGSPPGQAATVATQPITFAGPQGRTLQAAWAAAEQPRGAVLVIHENRGLNDHIRSVAERLAGSGYSALAIDLLSAEGGTDSLGDPAAAMAALSQVPDVRFVADLKAAVGELQRRVPGAKVGTVGFCFGGGMVWTLLASGEPRLSAAAPFYGPTPDNADFSGSKGAAVLGVYAELDQRVNATRDAAREALERAGLRHEIVTFPGANHAFFNDTGPRYNAAAAADAYRRLLDWFGRYLAG